MMLRARSALTVVAGMRSQASGAASASTALCRGAKRFAGLCAVPRPLIAMVASPVTEYCI
jgi:hypothetical protein